MYIKINDWLSLEGTNATDRFSSAEIQNLVSDLFPATATGEMLLKFFEDYGGTYYKDFLANIRYLVKSLEPSQKGELPEQHLLGHFNTVVYILEVSLSDVPLYINSADYVVKSVAKWRLEKGR